MAAGRRRAATPKLLALLGIRRIIIAPQQEHHTLYKAPDRSGVLVPLGVFDHDDATFERQDSVFFSPETFLHHALARAFANDTRFKQRIPTSSSTKLKFTLRLDVSVSSCLVKSMAVMNDHKRPGYAPWNCNI
ncbi:uncharacterized protein PHACADRAFT_261285 [Phanerochaete carnosa HHB-10118-sp]|uniref:Uncharacterized protein n=1 Tax=Phanerochaete carnosa (strain HHB-10118-sp) TaxID=650164 RepID=K5VMJ7_PHACS|nr:uncharacterized protein PHACADRAFT_261285 [Phanerochaete carnosa HHB-10118-sp]EKM52693.1 hypothetical protein PHACADRAFT_261285 [Phanerochaete carnosa HHB-10118-sp]